MHIAFLRASLAPSLLAVIAIASSSCGGSTPTRDANHRVTVGRTLSSAGVTYQQIGDAPPTQISLEIASNGCSDSTYRDVAGSLADPVISRFATAYDTLLALENDRNLDRRATVVAAARAEFRAIHATATDQLIGLAAPVNVLCCDIALGDSIAFQADRALLPAERDRTSTSAVAADTFGLLTGSDRVAQDAILANTSQMRCTPPRTGEALIAKKVIKKVMRTVTPAVQPDFQFLDGSQALQTFPGVALTLTPFDDTREHLTLTLFAQNKTDRVITLAGMALRLTHRGQPTTYRTAEAAYRLLPGDRSQIRLAQKDTPALDDFRQVLGSASEGASSLTLFDAPTEFDALGAVTKKENVTWTFTYTPGADAITELDPTKSTWEWMAFQRGMDRLQKQP